MGSSNPSSSAPQNLKAPAPPGFFVLWPIRMKRPASMRIGRKTKNERQRTFRFCGDTPPYGITSVIPPRLLSIN
jgi:hypothetical protein